jgi:putative FmdB family regulatory protein
MPTYEYECTKCSHAFEVFQKITDLPLNKCPKCGKKVKRLIGSGSGIIFSHHNSFYTLRWDPVQKLISRTGKGSGFYATDYRKKPPPQNVSDSAPSSCAKNKEGCDTCTRAG